MPYVVLEHHMPSRDSRHSILMVNQARHVRKLPGPKFSLDREECFIARGSYIPNQTNAHLVLVLNFFLIPFGDKSKRGLLPSPRFAHNPINNPFTPAT
jgi:hypothetical protein